MRQIRIAPNGLWHRPARSGATHTACGIEILGAVASREGNRALNHLCPICWTPHELDTGEIEKITREHAEEHPDQYFDSSEEPTKPGDPE